jgi:hypothetical protein
LGSPQDDEKLPDAATFLRRASFDLAGEPPSVEAQQRFLADHSAERHAALVDRLLADPQFGVNWANYWSDVMAYRVPPPELTYLNYTPLKTWLADKLNSGESWDEVVQALVTAKGKVADQPPATFVGYHQAKATNLAAETSRIFLGQLIACAECHDHPFASWKREQFHAMAAFFAKSKTKLPWNDGAGTVVSIDKDKEYKMSDTADPEAEGTELQPVFLDGRPIDAGQTDAERRKRLAEWLTSPDNPWFAKAYTNRVWARLVGRGFYEPVDDLGASQSPSMPRVHEALADHFIASGFDVKDLFRLVMNSQTYARAVARTDAAMPGSAPPQRLRGDEIFAALEQAIELPNLTPAAVAPTDAVRFPPPPQSTRDLVNKAFGADPSLAAVDAPRTMTQALWMMNNDQLLAQINGTPGSGTVLARLLESEKDDRELCRQLFLRVLAREATSEELKVALDEIAAGENRQSACEDLLWALLNSAEFTAKR